MKNLLFLISILFALILAYSCSHHKTKSYDNTKNEKYIDVPGTRLSIIPPEGFQFMEQAPQFLEKNGNSQIGIFEMNESYFNIVTMYSEEYYENIPESEIISINDIYINGYNGRELLIKETGNRKKYMLLFGNNDFCVAIGGSYDIDFEISLANKIKNAALSVVYNPNKKLDTAEFLPYEINTSGTKLELAGSTQGFSFYTVGGEDPVSGLDRTELYIGGRKLDDSNQWTEDVIYENIHDVMNYEGKFGLEIGKTKKVIIDEMDGYETVGYVLADSDTIKIIYYLFLIDQNDIYGITGRSNMDFDKNLELLRNISMTFKRN
jgi:hypothetical protein